MAITLLNRTCEHEYCREIAEYIISGVIEHKAQLHLTDSATCSLHLGIMLELFIQESGLPNVTVYRIREFDWNE